MENGKLIVWLSGNSGAGKSFTGDYLARYAGFFHVDGDALSRSQVPEERQLFANLVKAFGSWFEEQSAPRELWEPYYSFMCDRVRETLVEYDKVVISLTVYHRETRDFIRQKLPEHLFILLRCSKGELIRRARVRFSEYAKSRDKSFQEAWEEQHRESFSEEKFDTKTLYIMRGLQPIHSDENLCYEVDVSNGAPWEQLHSILNLPLPSTENISIEEIAAINYNRFQAIKDPIETPP